MSDPSARSGPRSVDVPHGIRVRTVRGRRGAPRPPRRWLLTLARDVDQPVHCEPVLDLPELIAPRRLVKRYVDRAALGQMVPVAVQQVALRAAQADVAVRRLAGGARRVVRGHQREALRGFELAVHHAVRIDRLALVLGHAHVAEGHHVELAAEDVAVERDRLARVAIEVQVGVERGHCASLVGWSSLTDPTVPSPRPAVKSLGGSRSGLSVVPTTMASWFSQTSPTPRPP